jgi:hypothetical protein
MSANETNRGHVPEAATGTIHPVAVLGAGPIGLEVALAARDAGLGVRTYEASPRPAGHVRQWGHVRLFTPWSMNVSPRMARGLAELGRDVGSDDPQASPTGHELADRVLDPLWSLDGIGDGLSTGVRVVAVGRDGTLKHEAIGGGERHRRPFRILLRDDQGREWVERAQRVFDCTGTWGNPNPLGDGGIPAPGEGSLAHRISRRIPNLEREASEWAGRRILLAGAGHSAQTAVRELARLAEEEGKTQVHWVLRDASPDWGAVEDDPLPLRRELTTAAGELASGASPAVTAWRGCVVERLENGGSGVRVQLRGDEGTGREVEVDRVLSLTGGVGDHMLHRQLQVHECYATCGPMKLSAALLGAAGDAGGTDCLEQESHGAETLKNPEPNFFILGDKSYGRNSTFLMRVGWAQVDEVFGALVR